MGIYQAGKFMPNNDIVCSMENEVSSAFGA